MTAFFRKQSLEITSTQSTCQTIYASKAQPRDNFANYMESCLFIAQAHQNSDGISIFFLEFYICKSQPEYFATRSLC